MDEEQAIQRELIDGFLPEASELVQRVARQTAALMEDPQSGAIRQELVEDLDHLGKEAGILDFDSLAAVAHGISRLLRGAEKGTVYPELLSDLLSDGQEAISRGFERLGDHDNRPLEVDTLLHRIEVVLRSRDADLLSAPLDEELSADSESLFDADGSVNSLGLATPGSDDAGDEFSAITPKPTSEGLVANLTIDPAEWGDDGLVEAGDEGDFEISQERPLAMPQEMDSTDPDAPLDSPDSGERAAEVLGGGEVGAATDRIDDIIELADELVLERDRLLQLKRVLHEESGRDSDVSPLFAATERVGLLAKELRYSAVGLRMVPATQIFSSLVGLVSELARAADKEVQLVIEDGVATLDRLVVEEVGELLVNLIRNAIAHGIEVPEVRSDAGKSPTATLSLSAEAQGERVLIRLVDDGGGLDLEQVQEFPNTQQRHQILSPGFADFGTMTEWSGLGVGMKVIEGAVARLNGAIEMQSDPGQGTEISIRLPSSVSTIQGVQVSVGGEVFVIPRPSIIEVLRISDAGAVVVRDAKVILVREKLLTLIDLDAELDLDPAQRVVDETHLVVVRAAHRQAGLVVDKVIGHLYVAVDELGDLVGAATGIAGATILENGCVRLILDMSVLLEQTDRRSGPDAEAESETV